MLNPPIASSSSSSSGQVAVQAPGVNLTQASEASEQAFINFPIFYRLDKEGFPSSYLFGAVHFATFENSPYYPEISDGFRQATCYISELGEEIILATKEKEKNRIVVEKMETMSLAELSSVPGYQDTFNTIRNKIVLFVESLSWKDSIGGLSKGSFINEKGELQNCSWVELVKNIYRLLEALARSDEESLRFLESYEPYQEVKKWQEASEKELEQAKLISTFSSEAYIASLNEEIKKSSIEERLAAAAKKQGKTLITLDGIAKQKDVISKDEFLNENQKLKNRLSSIENMPLAILKTLEGLLMNLEEDPFACFDALCKSLINTYQAEHLKNHLLLINELLLECYRHQCMLTSVVQGNDVAERAGSWMPTILPLLKTHPSFIAVGLGHLGGTPDRDPENSLLKLFEKEGFKITQLTCPTVMDAPKTAVLTQTAGHAEQSIDPQKPEIEVTQPAKALTFQFNNPSTNSDSKPEKENKSQRPKRKNHHWTHRKKHKV